MQHAAVAFRHGGPPTKGSNVPVKTPSTMPDLSSVSRLCPKNTIFSYFSDNHLRGVQHVKDILMKQSSREDFMSMACVCRDSANINNQLWIFAFASAVLERQDMRGFRIPAFVEICPDMFTTPAVTKMAKEQAMLPPEDRSVIEVSPIPTGNDSNPENRLAYFREEIGINAHHWHWHLVYTRNTAKGVRDRKGELLKLLCKMGLFRVVARYNAERLANDLPITKRINLEDDTIVEGYFPKLYSNNAGRVWGTRQENTKFQDVERSEANVRIEDLRKWRDRIFEAIDAKVLIGSNRTMIPLTAETGTDLLGDLLENSGLSINPTFYGNLHNLGHNLFAFAHDPFGHHREDQAVLADTPTAMRDPVFYRWHSFINDIFDRFKRTLPQYNIEQLVWSGVQVTDISVSSERGANPNTLVTNWLKSDVDLARGLDLGRSRTTGGEIWARFTHLNHEPFKYTINVRNSGRTPLNATVRIFMAPRENERKRRHNLNEQRSLFIEMDKFAFTLQPGPNTIERESTESAVTIPWSQSFKQLEKVADAMADSIQSFDAVCGCGWPENMLIPRGNATGMVFDLYVIVTNGAEDQVVRKKLRTAGQEQNCKESITFCGILDELYPDKKQMGFPFDRYPALDSNNQIPTLDGFVQNVPNSKTVQIRVIHRDITRIREGGAPGGMEIMVEKNPDSRPASPSPSPTLIGREEFTKGPTQGRPSPMRPPVWTPNSIPASPAKPTPTFGSGGWGRPSTPRNEGGWNAGRGRHTPNRWGRPGRETSQSPPPEEWTYV